MGLAAVDEKGAEVGLGSLMGRRMRELKRTLMITIR